MQLTYFGKGFNFNQDGPGNRLVYHLQGCNMHCPWCANPEGIPLDGPLMVDKNRLLDEVCPYGAIANGQLDRSRCETCSDRPCLTDRRNQGILAKAVSLDIESVWSEILRSSPMYFAGGGVTFTGGEASLQLDAVLELMKRCREHAISTAIETNGTNPRLPELFPWLDHLIMDVKHGSSDKLMTVAGQPLKHIEANLVAAAEAGLDVLVRIPIIGGFNTSEQDKKEFIDFMERFDKSRIRIECLRFHEYGVKKWVAIGQEYALDESARVSKKQIAEWQETLRMAGWQVTTT